MTYLAIFTLTMTAIALALIAAIATGYVERRAVRRAQIERRLAKLFE